jgi:imidazoleglycerol-phosphate dehydratase
LISRRAVVERTTKETQIDLRLELDGGPIDISTDVKFLDHMLEAFAKHSGCGLSIVARGDGMDHHHLIEDVGIALGKAIYDALGDKRGIERYGSQMVPLDDALVACSIDLSGRSYLNFQVEFLVENLGDFKTEMIREFFRAVSDNGRFNLHLMQMNGDVAHHLCEASFKAFARSFKLARRAPGATRFSRPKACWSNAHRAPRSVTPPEDDRSGDARVLSLIAYALRRMKRSADRSFRTANSGGMMRRSIPEPVAPGGPSAGALRLL